MKLSFKTAAFSAVLLLGSSTALRADINDLVALAMYADQLTDHGIAGGRFVELVDDRYWGMYPGYETPGMGSYVQELHARGLRGRALADAIHAEQARRGFAYPGKGNGNAGVKIKPLPPGQAKKYGVQPIQVPPGQMKMKPKEKATFFGGGSPGKAHGHDNGHSNGHGKGKKK